ARDQPRRCRDKLDRPLAGALWQLDLFLPETKDKPAWHCPAPGISQKLTQLLFVRVLLQAIASAKKVAFSNPREVLAAPRFLPNRLLRALPEHRQLDLAHGPFRNSDILPKNSPLMF